MSDINLSENAAKALELIDTIPRENLDQAKD